MGTRSTTVKAGRRKTVLLRGTTSRCAGRLKAGCTVESPTQLVEKPWPPHWAFITIGGPQAHPDSQDWLPHKVALAPALRGEPIGQSRVAKIGYRQFHPRQRSQCGS